MTQPLIEIRDINKSFPLPDGGQFQVLRDISLTVNKGEVVALLGRSGSGKSTLLRIMAGLLPPSSGTCASSGTHVSGGNPDVAMVFQSFALLPWLTVIENVMLGLEAQGVSRVERTKRALKAIDRVGLDGFESAYPKELSGGMKQRVGFARATVIQPKVLFLDEPFSALDVLTAENLRGEIDELWNSGSFPSESILIVTHNIEEAVFLADRVVILGSNPGVVRGELTVDLPRPHDRTTARFQELVDQIYSIMTHPTAVVVPTTTATAAPATPVGYKARLPNVHAETVSGLLELLSEQGDDEHEVAEVSERLGVTTDALLTLLDACTMLGFATVDRGRITLTPIGRQFADATIEHSKEIFRNQVLANAPMISAMRGVLMSKSDHSMYFDFFLDLLEEQYPAEEARMQLLTAIDWARYSELFEYDANASRLYLSADEIAI